MNPVVRKVAEAIKAELKEQTYTYEGRDYMVVDGDVDPAGLAWAAIEALGLTADVSGADFAGRATAPSEMVNSIPGGADG